MKSKINKLSHNQYANIFIFCKFRNSQSKDLYSTYYVRKAIYFIKYMKTNIFNV